MQDELPVCCNRHQEARAHPTAHWALALVRKFLFIEFLHSPKGRRAPEMGFFKRPQKL
jgi:hypothetical protein